MEEFFGADLDDDLFESKQTKSKNTQESVPWTPLTCEPEWFHGEQSNRNTDCDANSDHSTTSIKHYQAHHLFYSSKFAEAAKIYSELLNLVPPTNVQMRREITDGLTRSYLKAKKYSEALTASQELAKTCKNKWQRAAWHTLVAEIHRCNLNYDKELLHLQSTIMVHQLNGDLWLRAAECYNTIATNEDLYQVGSLRLSQMADSTWHAAASLVRAHVILNSVIKAYGGETFGRKRCRNLLEKIEPVISSLPLGFVSKAVQALSRDVYSADQRENSEFEDLGSSKHKASNEDEEDETDDLEQVKQRFESHWFSFESTIELNDLSCAV